MFSFLLHLSPVYYVENLHTLEKETGKITHVTLLTITLDIVAYLLAVMVCRIFFFIVIPLVITWHF